MVIEYRLAFGVRGYLRLDMTWIASMLIMCAVIRLVWTMLCRPMVTLAHLRRCCLDGTDGMTYHEQVEALGGDSYDFDNVVDYQPGYFDDDDP